MWISFGVSSEEEGEGLWGATSQDRYAISLSIPS